MIIVVLKNGTEVQVTEATKVEPAAFKSEGPLGATIMGSAGIKCTDDEGKLRGQFHVSEVAGWYLR